MMSGQLSAVARQRIAVSWRILKTRSSWCVRGISSDIVSDIATNIIRQPLVRYTNEMAQHYGIPVEPEVDSGPLWNPRSKQWFSEFVPLAVTEYGKLLLVPKAIVRRKTEYDSEEYFQHYILEHLRQVELTANSELVHLLRDGRRRVTKKDLIAKYGRGKEVNLRITLEEPDLLRRYRADKRSDVRPPLDHEDLAFCEESDPPDWDALLATVLSVERGPAGAAAYESAIESLLTAVFYPSLTNPQTQTEIHAGRKRIDVTYTNCAVTGFFHWLGQHYAAPHVFVECKNYSGDPANPELDQLSGRFSPSRGEFGFLVCRQIRDKDLFVQRCRDTASDRRGFIVPLDDDDWVEVLRERKKSADPLSFSFVQRRFESLVL